MTPTSHFEPYLYLAGLTADAALISWGGFWFREDDGGTLRLVDDDDVSGVDPGRVDTIGACSEPYGDAVVEVLDGDGEVAARATTDAANHVWLKGLEPSTEYRYRVSVDGEEWAAGPRRDWRSGPDAGLAPPERHYDNTFRTHPASEDDDPLTFLVVGDFGYGVRGDDPDSQRQRAVARAMHAAAEQYDARLVLTVGDNIYLGEDETDDGRSRAEHDGTGDEDDDWFFTFYQPYRYLLNRLPWYPAVGNHDAGETEKSDDREQVDDNFFLAHRFKGDVESSRTSLGPGLFYSFDVGALVDFVAVDTTEASELDEERYFSHPNHRGYLDEEFPDRDGRTEQKPVWHIPFSHHPPYCAGPKHENDQAMLDELVPLYRRAGVRCVLAGHEHNFQWSEQDGMHFFVSGAGAKLRSEKPEGMAEARTRGWSGEAHFLMCRLDGQRLEVTPWAALEEDRELEPIGVVDPDGNAVALPIVIGH